jgi:Tol biopolymer transport system component
MWKESKMSARFREINQGWWASTIITFGFASIAVMSLRWVARASSDELVTTSRVSVDSAGAQANGESTGAVISADGRYVAFVSWAANLASGDSNDLGDVFVKDRQAGTTSRVSAGSGGSQGNGESYEPAISADGRHVAFTSDGFNLVANDTNQVSDVFVRDMTTGVTQRVSLAADGSQVNGASNGAAISSDGRFVAFHSNATNLVAGDTNKQGDIFLRDMQAGTTERVSVSAAGVESDGSSEGDSISEDGRFVAFASTAGNLISPPDTNKVWDVFVRDRTTGSVVRASVSCLGAEGDGHSSAPSMSADGNAIAFESEATNLVPGDTNHCADVFVRDVVAGMTTRVSVGISGAQANGASTHPSISADGRFVAFLSAASNLVSGDTNAAPDIFVYDRQSGSTSRVNLGNLGAQSDKAATWAALSRDGRYIAFPSGSGQLVSGDSNGEVDVFVRGPLF